MSYNDFNKYVITDKELIKSKKSSNKYSFVIKVINNDVFCSKLRLI